MTTLGDLDGRLFAYVPEVAQILGRDERTIRKAIRDGQIPASKTGTRYLVPVSWLREQAGMAEAQTAALPDLDELADLVADRVARKIFGAFAALAPDMRTAGPPDPAVTAVDPLPAKERSRVHDNPAA
jgi:excisionase family DNA binding protein